MIDDLIKRGRSYKNKFTREYNLGAEHGIDSNLENEYLKWLSKIGKFVEIKLKSKFPNTTSQILKDRKSTRLNSSHANISYAVFCLKKKKITITYSLYKKLKQDS